MKPYFKFYNNGVLELQKQFIDLTAAQAYLATLGAGWTVDITPLVINLSVDERLEMDKVFGNELIDEFTRLSRANNLGSNSPMSLLDTKAIGTKLHDIQDMLQKGSIIQAEQELNLIVVDANFTQPIKNHFLQRISDYLAQFA